MRVKFTPHPKALVDSMAGNGVEMAAEQILNDCNYFARMASGDMIGSSHHEVSRTTIRLIWDTPYAARVYYTGTPSHAMNSNASLMWAEKAKNQFGKDWPKAIEEGMKR